MGRIQNMCLDLQCHVAFQETTFMLNKTMFLFVLCFL